ncbi:DUF2505 domain-containing protein [Rhodococcus sp. D2-41]|uniref:DUF2505 domain-containing protein n=1 Tax=Speluncibacter jeojiensis TaxID=2710754 RepID=A0A9X4RF76_9ACTN|nr:DUF2505 domain-containing protein [Rhodococcus sp. D2-41]MDG3009956.1 DUF2505 domain-containing protein [Rhodococcus sp. D2-41]MDG3016343.1 DUF2505 domain-containing protein [Corynebacteriales bacterium D3-21]
MARRIDYSARLPFSADRVYAALSDRDYWDGLMAEMRELTPTSHVESLTVEDSGIAVHLTQVIPRETLPTIAQTVMKKDLVITRKASYGPFDGDTAKGEFSASIPAGPGALDGTIELFNTPTGSTLRTSPEAKVFIPFVGSKLEQLMLVNLVDLFRAEAEFTEKWLSDRA